MFFSEGSVGLEPWRALLHDGGGPASRNMLGSMLTYIEIWKRSLYAIKKLLKIKIKKKKLGFMSFLVILIFLISKKLFRLLKSLIFLLNPDDSSSHLKRVCSF